MHSKSLSEEARRRKYENLFLALLEQDAATEIVRSYPIGLILDPSAACNLRCPMCPVSYENEIRPKSILRWDLFERFMEELGPYLFFVDFFNWGEPLLHKKLSEMLRTLNQFDIDTRISSSLSLQISDQVLESFIDYELDCLTVSIDGFTQETYEKYRVRGNLQLALSNMERLAAMKIKRKSNRPQIDWQYLVFSFNEHELNDAQKFAKEIGVNFCPTAPYVDIERHPEWLSTREEFIKPEYKSFWRNDPRNGDTSHTMENIAAISSESTLLDRDGVEPFYRCDWHYLVSVINANGSVSPCCSTQEEYYDFGNANDRSFHEVWNNGKFMRARRFFGTRGYSKLADPEGLLCYDCIAPHDQDHCVDYILRYLQAAPSSIFQQAQELLPNYWKVRLKAQQNGAVTGLKGRTRNDPYFAANIFVSSCGSVADLTTSDCEPHFISGFYQHEGYMRWLSDKGTIQLRVPEYCNSFFIEGYCPMQTVAAEPLRVRISAGAVFHGELVVFQGNFLNRLTLAHDFTKNRAGQLLEVTLETSFAYTPAELDKESNDTRKLSLVIKRIGFSSN